jgi:hypothetical protein
MKAHAGARCVRATVEKGDGNGFWVGFVDGGGGRAFVFCNSGSGKSGGRRGAVHAYFRIAGGY